LDAVRAQVSPGTAVELDSPLFEGGLGLDSIGFLQVILNIENKLGKRLRNEDLTEESLSSLGNFVRHIERHHAD
jgi:acyl carrier protein